MVDKGMKNIYIISTQYSLFLYMLINPNWKTDTVYIASGGLGFTEIERLEKHNISFLGGANLAKYRVLQSSNLLWRFLRKGISALWRIPILLFLFFENKTKWKVYGHEHVWPSILFLNAKWDYSVIEDGIGSYCSYEEALKQWKTTKLADIFYQRNYLPGGWSERVRNVYLTGLFSIPAGLKKKQGLLMFEKNGITWRSP